MNGSSVSGKILIILSILGTAIIILGSFGSVFKELGKSQERLDTFEKIVVDLKAELVELTYRQRNTELNTYAIAVKLEVEQIIKPLEK